MQEAEKRDLFEGGCTYRIKGTSQYLTLIEAADERWKRYYKAFVADRLDGAWRPFAAEWGNSFADTTRIRNDAVSSPDWAPRASPVPCPTRCARRNRRACSPPPTCT